MEEYERKRLIMIGIRRKGEKAFKTRTENGCLKYVEKRKGAASVNKTVLKISSAEKFQVTE